MKKEQNKKPKISKLAIASFILTFFPIFFTLLLMFFLRFESNPNYLILSILAPYSSFILILFFPQIFLVLELASFIMAISSLQQIKKYNLRGRGLAITSLVFCLIIVIFVIMAIAYLMFYAFHFDRIFA